MPSSEFSLAYCTNIWNHYTGSLCTELVTHLGTDHFKLCLCDQIYEEQRKLGWHSNAPGHQWIAGPPASNGDLRQLSDLVCDADVAVLASCAPEIQAARCATGKLTLIMGERIWKWPLYWWRMLNPRCARSVRRFKRMVTPSHVHYLAIGAYAAGDVRHIGAYGDRIWTWAYFPEVAAQPPLPGAKGKVRILWVGRMLKWKRVDLLLKAVACVCREPAFGSLEVVGTGPEQDRLMALASKLNLSGQCVFHKPVAPEQVRDFMRQADIYVLPSNRYEGWGVVANEAMSEGAVLVANEQAGAARVLIEDGRTGFLFRDGDVAGLASKLRTLMADAALRESVRQVAWQEMQRLWHPRVGAGRLIGLCHGLIGLAPMPAYQKGPCSRIAEARQ